MCGSAGDSRPDRISKWRLSERHIKKVGPGGPPLRFSLWSASSSLSDVTVLNNLFVLSRCARAPAARVPWRLRRPFCCPVRCPVRAACSLRSRLRLLPAWPAAWCPLWGPGRCAPGRHACPRRRLGCRCAPPKPLAAGRRGGFGAVAGNRGLFLFPVLKNLGAAPRVVPVVLVLLVSVLVAAARAVCGRLVGLAACGVCGSWRAGGFAPVTGWLVAAGWWLVAAGLGVLRTAEGHGVHVFLLVSGMFVGLLAGRVIGVWAGWLAG